MVQKLVNNHAMRVNHPHSARLTHPHTNRHVVPTSVLTRSMLVPLNAARTVTTVVPHSTVTSSRPVKHGVNKPYSPIRRPINHKPAPKHRNSHKTVTTVKMCDKKNSVLFTNTKCVVLSSDFKLPDENQVLLRVPRENNMYNVDLKNVVPSRDLMLEDLNTWLQEEGGHNRGYYSTRSSIYLWCRMSPNEEIFVELARMGYKKPPLKLTFYKAFFSAQWKFLIHTVVQCMSAKRTAWNEFISSMASVVIFLTIEGQEVRKEEKIKAFLFKEVKEGGMEEDVNAVKEVNADEPTVFDDKEVTMTMAHTIIKMKAKKARLLDEHIAKWLQDEEIELVDARERQEKEDLEKAKMQEKHLDNIQKYQSLKRKPISVAQARKNMIIYLMNMDGYKIQHFKGMTFDYVRPIFEREYNKRLRAEVEVSGSHSTQQQETPTVDPIEISKEDVQNMLQIVLMAEFKVEALQIKVVDGVVQVVAPTTAKQKLAKKNELKRFSGNKKTNKVQKTLLKQQYENFSGQCSKSLNQIHDRLQKLISQLEILGESLSQEDINLKFLRSLPSEWRTHTLIWRNKADLEDQSLDDLFNNLKIYEARAPASILPNVDNPSDVVIYSFFANGHAYHEIQEVSLKDWKESRSPKDTRNKDTQRRTVQVETSTLNALVSQCDGVDESVPTSSMHDRYQSGDGYHVVPPPYTRTFMPPKPNLVFHDAFTASETVPNVFNDEPNTTKPTKELCQSSRPSALIIKD
nr:hypothetical protein [Tanacetum cinerariifolium]